MLSPPRDSNLEKNIGNNEFGNEFGNEMEMNGKFDGLMSGALTAEGGFHAIHATKKPEGVAGLKHFQFKTF